MRFKPKIIENHLKIILINTLKNNTLPSKSQTNTIQSKKHSVRPKMGCIGQRDYKTRINNAKFAV